MKQDKKKLMLLSVVATVAVVLAVFMAVKSMKGPQETITRYEDVPPKGAGKSDRM